MIPIFLTIWQCRGFIYESVRRDFLSKYSNSVLGIIWSAVSPLAMITIYTLIFSQVMKSRIDTIDSAYGYSIYVCSGIIFWTFFSDSMLKLLNVFIDNANLLKKINFPRVTLPIIAVLGAVLNLVIILTIFGVFLLFSGNFPGVYGLAIVPVLIVEILFVIGLGLNLAIFNVFFRDVGQLFSIVLQLWFWLTPIVYPISIVPSVFQNLFELNPMYHLIDSYHDIFVSGVWPDWWSLLSVFGLSCVLCISGHYMFRRYSAEMVDEL